MLATSVVLEADPQTIVTDLQAGTPPSETIGVSSPPVFDAVTGIALAPTGTLYVVGYTNSPVFPLAPSKPTDNGITPFVASLNSSRTAYEVVQTLEIEGIPIIATDSEGNVYLGGSAIAPSGATLFGPGSSTSDVAVTKMDSSLSHILWQVFLGGSAGNYINGIVVDLAGNVYVTGETNSTDWPVTKGAFQSVNHASSGTGFVAAIAASGTPLLWSTYLGGSNSDIPKAIAIAPNGAVYVTGTTSSTDFPVTAGALETTGVGGFISEFSSDGSKLLASTYLTGPDGNAGIVSLASDPDGSVTVAGFAGADGSVPGFVARLNGSLSTQVFSRFLGGSGALINSVFVDANNLTYVAGVTPGELTTVRAVQPEFFAAPCTVYTPDGGIQGPGECNQGLLVQLDASGKILLSTYLNGYGGMEGATAKAVVSDGMGNAFVGGSGVLSFAGPQAAQTAGAAFLVDLKVNMTPPLLLSAGVTNAASFVTGLPPPGSLASIFCSGLTGIPSLEIAGFPFPLTLYGVTVTIGGVPAPIIALADFGSYQQIDLQVPWNQQSDDIEVSQGSVAAWITQDDSTTSPPGIFTVDGVHGAIQHADFSLVTEANPAKPGEVVLVYATGLGPVATPIATDQLAPVSPLDMTTQQVTVSVAGKPAAVLYAGLAPGELGVYQLNVQLPRNLAAGDQDLVIALPEVTDYQPPYFSPSQYQRVSAPVKVAIE